jgi:hypothetical protein
MGVVARQHFMGFVARWHLALLRLMPILHEYVAFDAEPTRFCCDADTTLLLVLTPQECAAVVADVTRIYCGWW